MLRHNRSKNINQHKHKKGNARLGKQTESKLRVDLRFGFTTEEEGKKEKKGREETRRADEGTNRRKTIFLRSAGHLQQPISFVTSPGDASKR